MNQVPQRNRGSGRCGWMDGEMDRLINGGWMDGWMDPKKWGVMSVIMEAERSQDLQSASQRPRRVDGVVAAQV
jgi:hypothetical protein